MRKSTRRLASVLEFRGVEGIENWTGHSTLLRGSLLNSSVLSCGEVAVVWPNHVRVSSFRHCHIISFTSVLGCINSYPGLLVAHTVQGRQAHFTDQRPVFRQFCWVETMHLQGLSSHGFNGWNGSVSSFFYKQKTNSLSVLLSLSGHYVYVDTSFAKQGEKAVLLSSDLQAEEWNCLRLVYQITAPLGPVSEPSQLNLYMRFEDESFDRLLWSTKEPSDSWLIASLDLPNNSKKFKVGGAEEEDMRLTLCSMNSYDSGAQLSEF